MWVTWPNIAFTYSAPWSTYAFKVPALKLPGDSCEAHFPLETSTTSGRGWQHHMWIHTDLWTQDALYLRKHNESEPEECGRIPATRVFFEKTLMWERSAASQINLQSHWTQDVFYLRKHMESGRVSATHVLVEKRNWIRERLVACHMNLQSQWTQDAFYMRNTWNLGDQYSAQFTWENIARGARGSSVACKCTVKMKARRILHKKTQRFLWGRMEYIYIYKYRLIRNRDRSRSRSRNRSQSFYISNEKN